MLAVSVPSEVRTIADQIKHLYKNKVEYAHLCAIISYFLFAKGSVCQAVRDLAFLPSVSTMTTQMKVLNPNRFMRRLRDSITKSRDLNSSDWIYVLDDTSNPRYGDFFRTGYWGSSAGVYRGQKVMVVALVNLRTKKSYPIDYALIPKRTGKRSPKMHRHARNLMDRVLRSGFPKLQVAADSWFDSAAFIRSLERLGLTFVFQLKSNRRVKTNPGPNCRWLKLVDAFREVQRKRTKTSWDSHRVKKGFKRGKAIAELHLIIKNRGKSLKVIGVYERRNSKKAFGYYASTDQSMSRARIWMISRARWSIEVIFRCCKQHLSFGQLSCKGKDAAHLAVAMPFFLYCKLSDMCPDGLSVDRYLATIRERSFQKTLDSVLHNPGSDRVQRLRIRRSPDRVHRKPVSSTCGKERRAA